MILNSILKIIYILELIEEKITITTILFALGFSKDKIIDTFYTKDKYTYNTETKSWNTNFVPENYKRPIKITYDLIDGNTGKKVLAKGEKLNLIIAKKLSEKGLKTISIPNEQVVGKYLAKDIKDKSNQILVGAGFDVTEEQLEKIISQSIKEIYLVNIDPINKGHIF